MYCLCVSTKTISLREEAYERLRRAKRGPADSFSDVVMRATWPEAPLTAGAWLTLVRERGPQYRISELDQIDKIRATDTPPSDKWPTG